MTNTERLQHVWDAKDLAGVFAMFTDDVVMKIHHENKSLSGLRCARRSFTSMVEDEDDFHRVSDHL